MPGSLDNLDCESLGSTISSPPSPGSPTSPTHSLHRLDRKSSVRQYHTKDAYLYAMKEDLAVWFNDLYNTNLTAENLLDNLQDGTFLCLHANNVKSYIEASNHSGTDIPNIVYRTGAKPGSFHARDNLANFINWVKNHLAVNEVLLFESDDLVLMKNQKNVVLCLLEVARRGARYGMLAPMLVQFEQEIDELEQKIKRAEGRRNSQGSVNNDNATATSDTESDKASLDEWVQSVVHQCTCPKQFPLINVSRGKYRIGYTQNVVFVRILRNHVMIRVGGGWDTLGHYLDKHDPCRCSKTHKATKIRQRTRHRTSTAKEPASSISREKSPAVESRTRSHSFTSADIPSSQSTPVKPKSRSGSTDLLNSNLVITRDDSGRHVIDDSTSSDTATSPVKSPSIPSTKNNQQKSRNSLGVSPSRQMLGRSSSPSHDLIQKWKDNLQSQTSNKVRERSNSRARKGYSSETDDDQKNRNRSATRTSEGKNRSLSRTRHSSSPMRNTARSRSFSRTATSASTNGAAISNDALKRRATIQASPRKDRRHSNTLQRTRIPAPLPVDSLSSSQQANSSMVSSTSTGNSSMDSLKTI